MNLPDAAHQLCSVVSEHVFAVLHRIAVNLNRVGKADSRWPTFRGGRFRIRLRRTFRNDKRWIEHLAIVIGSIKDAYFHAKAPAA
jgi:hypothetical protein